MDINDATSIAKFADIAREYCAWCEGSRATDPRMLLFQATRLLARLYAAGLYLPDVTLDDYPEAPEISTDARHAMFKSFATLPFQYYREVFNPSIESSDEPVTGDLADDFADIYVDLKSGLDLFEQGFELAAVWTWRMLLGIHWGRHATSALRALHNFELPDE